MTYTVSITSQGQISIPVHFRQKLGLNKKSKAFVTEQKGKLIIEPVKDFLECGGSLKTKIKASPHQVREAFEKYLAEEAVENSQ